VQTTATPTETTQTTVVNNKPQSSSTVQLLSISPSSSLLVQPLHAALAAGLLERLLCHHHQLQSVVPRRWQRRLASACKQARVSSRRSLTFRFVVACSFGCMVAPSVSFTHILHRTPASPASPWLQKTKRRCWSLCGTAIQPSRMSPFVQTRNLRMQIWHKHWKRTRTSQMSLWCCTDVSTKFVGKLCFRQSRHERIWWRSTSRMFLRIPTGGVTPQW